jgi:NAD+ synthase (glutamine-hydrolysing)
MSENSSPETRSRAERLARDLGSYHLDTNIDTIVTAVFNLFVQVTMKTPKYKVYRGSETENLALQNIQARLRMVMSYMFVQLLPWTRGRVGGLLVLGSANVDETYFHL